jgi:outer membrane protein TolC
MSAYPSHVESDVRNAWLDLEAATTQIGLAEKNLAVTRESLELTKQRYEAGVSDNLEVVQAQDAVASADLDYINSIFAHNVAKLSLARAMGVAADKYGDFLKAK